MRPRRGRACTALCIAASLACTSACTDKPEPEARRRPSTERHEFTVGRVPAGYVGVMAGEGTTGPAWGSDDGADEPFTVLTEDGTPTGEGVVVVSFAGYEGRENGFFGASRNHSGANWQELEVDGRPALFVEGAVDDEGVARWSDLLVDQGDDLAVRITAPEASLADLRDIYPSVTVIPGSHDLAPEIVDPPHGLEVAGSTDLIAVAALSDFVSPERRQVPGPPGSLSASWERKGSTRDQLIVIAIPADTVDLGVLSYAAHVDRFVRQQRDVDVAGDPGIVLETPSWRDSSITERAVVSAAPWGGVIVTLSRGDQQALGVEDLLAVSSSVRRATEPEWEAFADALDGGPGFGADLSRTEATRGEVDGLAWLLQTPDISQFLPDEFPPPVDGCLKLSDGSRRCAGSGEYSERHGVFGSNGPGRPFLIVWTQLPVGMLQVVGFGREPVGDRAGFAPVPGTDARAAVVFLPEDKNLRCDLPYSQSEISVRVLAEDGTDLGCASINREGGWTEGKP